MNPAFEKILSAGVEVAGILNKCHELTKSMTLNEPQWSHINSNHFYNQFSIRFALLSEQEARTELEKEFSMVLWLAIRLEG